VTLPANGLSYILRNVDEEFQFCRITVASINEKGVGEGQDANIKAEGFDEYDGITSPAKVSLSSDLNTLTVTWTFANIKTFNIT